MNTIPSRKARHRSNVTAASYSPTTKTVAALTGAALIAGGVTLATTTLASADWNDDPTPAGVAFAGDIGVREAYDVSYTNIEGGEAGVNYYAWCALEYPLGAANAYSGNYETNFYSEWTPILTFDGASNELVYGDTITGETAQAIAYLNAVVMVDGTAPGDADVELYKGTQDWVAGVLQETDPYFVANEQAIRDLWDEALTHHGPYYVEPVINIDDVTGTGTVTNIVPRSVHNDEPYPHQTNVTVTVTGGDVDLGNDTNTLTYVWDPAAPSSTTVNFDIYDIYDAEEGLTANVEFERLPTDYLVVHEPTDGPEFVNPAVPASAFGGQALFALGQFLPVAGDTQDPISFQGFELNVSTVLNQPAIGEPLTDVVTFSAVEYDGFQWTPDLPVIAFVQFYGPFEQPSEQSVTAPAGAPTVGDPVEVILAPGPDGDEWTTTVQSQLDTGELVNVTEPGAYTAVISINYIHQSPAVQALWQGDVEWSAPFFEPSETGFVPFTPSIDTSVVGGEPGAPARFTVASNDTTVTVVDTVTQDGFPNSHGEFQGLPDTPLGSAQTILNADSTTINHTVYHVSDDIVDEWGDDVCVPENAVEVNYEHAPGNGTQEVEFDVAIGDRQGTFVIVSEFPGDSRSERVLTDCFNPAESFVVVRDTPTTPPPTTPPTPSTPDTPDEGTSTPPDLAKTGAGSNTATLAIAGALVAAGAGALGVTRRFGVNTE